MVMVMVIWLWLWLYTRPWSGPTNLPTRVASAPCRLSCGDAAAPQTVEGLTRPPRTNAMPASPSRARAEGVDDVLFGKPLLALGWGGL